MNKQFPVNTSLRAVNAIDFYKSGHHQQCVYYNGKIMGAETSLQEIRNRLWDGAL